MSPSASSHELVDHTSEVILRIRAPDYPELIVEAARGFAALAPDHLGGEPDPEPREVRVAPADRPRMLVDWLNELVFLAEAEAWVPEEVQVRVAEGGGLVIEARGKHLDRPFVLVKAANLHDLAFHETSNGIESEVTLDI